MEGVVLKKKLFRKNPDSMERSEVRVLKLGAVKSAAFRKGL